MTLAALTSIDPATGKAFLGAVNASLNALSAVLLVTAFVMIKQRKWRAHATFMIAAVCTSALFLTFYLSSYYLFGEKSTGLARDNWLFWLYLIVLIPHVLLAVGMLPLIGMALLRAYQRQFRLHTRWSIPAFWIWLYVSVTGVIVYFMLYHLLPYAA